jgi:hypothetical protein
VKDRSDEKDWQGVAVSLAASNARLCGIAIDADKLAAEVEKLLEAHGRDTAVSWRFKLVRDALDAYKITRNGH